MRRFPDSFLFGVATSGHQTEGDNTSSDTWFLENVQPTVFVERSGRACNSWELWREDLDLVQAMGLDTFRFSVELSTLVRQARRLAGSRRTGAVRPVLRQGDGQLR